jgi:hypothetical protein
METLLRADTGGWQGELVPDAEIPVAATKVPPLPKSARQRVKGR